MIVAYDYTKVGIYYTGPPNDAAYITRFVDTMKRPVKLLNDKLDLLKVHQQYHVNIFFIYTFPKLKTFKCIIYYDICFTECFSSVCRF